MNQQKETLYEIYQRSPQESLDELFARAAQRCPLHRGNKTAFISQAMFGLNNRTTRYGGYKNISKAYLAEHLHRIEFWDGAPSIFWLDLVHNERTYRPVLLSEADKYLDSTVI